jgi:hypothetical protein
MQAVWNNPEPMRSPPALRRRVDGLTLRETAAVPESLVARSPPRCLAMFAMIVTVASMSLNAVAPPETSATTAQVRQAVEKSLPLLEKDGLEWETKKCVSCHHGPWMMWSGYEAKKRGFRVNDKSLERVRANALKTYSKHPTLRPTSRDVLNDLAINVTYLIFGMGAAGEPDAETAKFFDKAAAHLLKQQKDDGSWHVVITKAPDGLMAPLLDRDDVTTAWALLALNHRKPADVPKEDLERSQKKGLKFLSDNPPGEYLQSLVVRILLYQRLGKTDDVKARVKQLLALQKPDGGWSQTKKLKSDALGTGQALVALTTAGLTATDPGVAKARSYLIKTQKEDGSWFVLSRAYQKPEFSSYLGTAWATLGLVRTLPQSRDTNTVARD